MFNFFETGGTGTSDIAKSQIKCFCYSNLTMSIKYSVCDFVWSGCDIKYRFARFVLLQLSEFYIAVLCIDMMQTGEKLRCTALAWSSFITNTHFMLISIFTTRQFTWKPGWITHYLLVSQWKFFLQANFSSAKPQQHKITFYLLGSLWSLLSLQLWKGWWYKLSPPCLSEVKITLLWCLWTFLLLL